MISAALTSSVPQPVPPSTRAAAATGPLWRRLLPALGAVLVALLSTGCMTTQGMQQALDDRDAEIRSLREERAALKSRIQSLQGSLDQAQADLAKARSAKPAPVVASAPVESFPELDALGIGYGMRDGRMVISIPSSITFASGKAALSGAGKSALQKVASTLRSKYPEAHYSIEGHTDSDPIRKSSFASNRELSLARSMAVLTFLVEDCSVPDDQCVVVGHGQYDPVATNATESDKARNRRVDIVVFSK